jgi:hypothetical protein
MGALADALMWLTIGLAVIVGLATLAVYAAGAA